ncbi:MAG: NAD-glutamate dehydrogenase [Sedimenticola thiotaurini]|uniref:NAD-glutamate dehydrogenase n=1 Tax=Sedimenticola thiotaurini TaxID=1543721 RepID=A0A558D471_9GAMM|nr:MAG: NAD-glutamate dehydrogenase [Sedimenticola thiotaurini]
MTKHKGLSLQQQMIDNLASYPDSKFTKQEREQIEQLLTIYYRHIPPSDLQSIAIVDLVGAVIAHWQLLKIRQPDTPSVRIYNPNFEEHGWQSPHTIIEIVTTDRVFLVDSLSMGLNRAGLTIHLTTHPLIRIERDKQGLLKEIKKPGDSNGVVESMIQFQVEKQPSADVLHALEKMVVDVIRDVTFANIDWLTMKQRVKSIRETIAQEKLPINPKQQAEAGDFLQWVDDDHFTFLAYCEFDVVSGKGKPALKLDRSSQLGLFQESCLNNQQADTIIPVAGEAYLSIPEYLIVTKSNAKSTVHRPAYMDFIGIKRFNKKGEVDGIYCLLGLFTSVAYNSPPKQIPLLRQKTQAVIRNSGLAPSSHSGKALENILTTYPRDALFQTPVDQLETMAMGILGLQERQRTRLFISRDIFNRFYSCLIYLPRERYNRELRLRIQKVLVAAFNGNEVEFSTFFTESTLARIHLIIHSPPDKEMDCTIEDLEAQVITATTTWRDELRVALNEQYGEAQASKYYKAYANAFPSGFREDFYPRTAAADVARIEEARLTGELGLNFYRPILESSENVHCRLYSAEKQVSLSDAIPILENMGLTVFGERPYRIRNQSIPIWIHDFSMNYSDGSGSLTDESNQLFQEAFLKVWQGEVDNDGFNQLVLAAGLRWKEVVLLRAYGRYFKQIKIPYSRSYIIESLTHNANITRLLVDLFNLKFNPENRPKPGAVEAILQKIETLLEAVVSLDQDRILRTYVNIIQSTLRTNFFQKDAEGKTKSYVSFKVDPRQVNGMPLPMPMFEIFVFSSRMEGVHLRGGKVARGGLRWSDRMEDFRTEVLGLMKAQMVKNTVIVPVGSKGGFIVKQPLIGLERDKMMEEVVYCYRTLLKGMLDITDNLKDGKVIPPLDVIRYDEDDPYLVVAADKGTATFSDIANGVADEYGYWLSDAFASGGSVGYDHKKMGITARGAWESVKRNFRELGVNIQTTDFRVVGIGDMAGDVFGNGMLLSRHIKLVAAFNHMHIFLDPDPDPEASFIERERMFVLPRSSWEDYNKKLISKGGGIYSRSAKSITLTEEVKAMVGAKVDKLTPTELIHLLLKAPVDLIWNGGIGTYVKSEQESHEQVGDKANDALRVNGNELRCKVFGEGGNLGVTQLGRVEFSSKGGLIYTDAVDNSAGVDCSDHEVNIKILLGQIVASGDMTVKQRNTLLADMTDEVGDLVLADNYAQTQAISMVVSEAPVRLNEHARFIDYLENEGRINRELEYLPSKKAIAERQAANRGLTKPEVAVLLAYSKMTYFDALIHSDIPDDSFLETELLDYFPKVLGERFSKEMLNHQLKREIISTHLTNSIVDHIGPGFGFRVREEVGTNIAGVTRAYLSASKIFSTDELWEQIEALDNQVPSSAQLEMMRMIAGLLEQSVIWILRSRQSNIVIKDLVEYFQKGVQDLAEHMPKPLAAKDRLALNKQIKYYMAAGVPRELAQQVSRMMMLSSSMDLVEVSKQRKVAIETAASLYFNLGATLEFHWVRDQIAKLSVQTHWHTMAKTRLIDTLNKHQRDLTSQILVTVKKQKSAKKMIEHWAEESRFAYDRHARMITDLRSRTSVDFAMLSVVVAGVGSLLKSDI